MKRSIYIVIFLVQYCVAVTGQSNVGQLDVDLSISSDLITYPLRSFDQRDKSYMGSSLLFEDWQNARIKLVNRDEFLREFLMVNYDLDGQVFIVKHAEKLFVLPPGIVDQIFIVDVENGGEEEYMLYKDDSGNYKLFKKLVDGKIQLLVRPNIKIIEPDYDVVLDVGNVRPKFVQFEELYVARDGKMYKLPKRRSQIRKSLEEQADLAYFLTEEKVNLKDKSALKDAILKLNSEIELKRNQ